jgi:hypothetical protein
LICCQKVERKIESKAEAKRKSKSKSKRKNKSKSKRKSKSKSKIESEDIAMLTSSISGITGVTGMGFASRFATFGSGLLTAILLRYPEIGSISCDQDELVLNMRFLVKGDYPFDKLEEILVDAWTVFNQMEGRSIEVFRIQRNTQELETLMLTRDLGSLTFDEINLSIQIIKNILGRKLISEEEILGEEDLIYQEDMIVQSLAAIRSKGPENSLTALRDGGRVLVFKA